MNGSNNQDFRNIPAIWPDIQGQLVLDVGCGVGLYTQELARRGAFAVGVDLNGNYLRQAKSSGCRAHFVRADAGHLPFRANTFGMAVSVEVLSHINPEIRREVLADICRVMAPGGTAFYTLHNRRRLTLSRWMRLRRARQVYHTNHLDVWPSVPADAQVMVGEVGMVVASSPHYLNYHSRFTYGFFVGFPKSARLLIAVEDLLSGFPFLRRLAITFLLSAIKPLVAVGDAANNNDLLRT